MVRSCPKCGLQGRVLKDKRGRPTYTLCPLGHTYDDLRPIACDCEGDEFHGKDGL